VLKETFKSFKITDLTFLIVSKIDPESIFRKAEDFDKLTLNDLKRLFPADLIRLNTHFQLYMVSDRSIHRLKRDSFGYYMNMLIINLDPSKKKKVPIKKQQQHHQALELVPAKPKKSATGSSFRLTATTGKQDPLIMTDDKAYGGELVEHFGGVGGIEESLRSIDQKLYLFGNAVRASKLPKKGNAKVVAYDVLPPFN
jgi:hypothetical protein